MTIKELHERTTELLEAYPEDTQVFVSVSSFDSCGEHIEYLDEPDLSLCSAFVEEKKYGHRTIKTWHKGIRENSEKVIIIE